MPRMDFSSIRTLHIAGIRRLGEEGQAGQTNYILYIYYGNVVLRMTGAMAAAKAWKNRWCPWRTWYRNLLWNALLSSFWI